MRRSVSIRGARITTADKDELLSELKLQRCLMVRGACDCYCRVYTPAYVISTDPGCFELERENRRYIFREYLCKVEKSIHAYGVMCDAPLMLAVR